MRQEIPGSVIGAVAAVIGEYYFSHTRLNSLFMESGAPGDIPEGNCVTKCSVWLKRCNDDPGVEPLKILGAVIQDYMDQQPPSSPFGRPTGRYDIAAGQKRIHNALDNNQLAYRSNGFIVRAGATPISKTLEDYLQTGDFSSIDAEFRRAVENIQRDPHASITAASAIIEAVLKFYLERFQMALPTKLNVTPLWAAVQPHLVQRLNADSVLALDQGKMLKGITTLIDGVGAFRSHIGSAHGRGPNPPCITVAEARLAVNASHTLSVFLMDIIHTY